MKKQYIILGFLLSVPVISQARIQHGHLQEMKAAIDMVRQEFENEHTGQREWRRDIPRALETIKYHLTEKHAHETFSDKAFALIIPWLKVVQQDIEGLANPEQFKQNIQSLIDRAQKILDKTAAKENGKQEKMGEEQMLEQLMQEISPALPEDQAEAFWGDVAKETERLKREQAHMPIKEKEQYLMGLEIEQEAPKPKPDIK